MPIPVPEPTSAQLVEMSDILSLTIELTSEAIAADESQDISNAKWAKTISDLSKFSELQDDSGDIKKVGSIEFFENKAAPQLLRLINRIRRRYGVQELESLGVAGMEETRSVPLEIVF